MLNPIEAPWLFIGGAFLVWVVIVSKSVFGGMEKRWWHYVIVLSVVAAGFGIDYFFDSAPEAIKKQIGRGRQAVVQAEPQEIANLLSPAYQDAVNGSKAEFMALCSKVLSKPVVENLAVGRRIVSIDENRAVVEVAADGKTAQGSVYAAMVPIFRLKMELVFTRENGEWLVRRASLREVNGRSMDWSRLR